MKNGKGKWLLCILLCAALLLAVYYLMAGRGKESAAQPEAVPSPAPTAVPAPEATFPADAVSAGRPGLYRIGGWLYALGQEGERLRQQDSVWTFDPSGRYTTGDPQLDACLADALHESGADELEGDQALRAAYSYIKSGFHYKVKEEDAHTEESGSVDWVNERALRFLTIEGGTCYGYAAAFGLMARCLGYEAHIVAGEVNQDYDPHAFVVIPENGTDYMYDPEMEDVRSEELDDFALYHRLNHENYSYWYEPAW